jgi:hypothetical protein
MDNLYLMQCTGTPVPCRCGALHVGDQILAVDEARVDGVTATAADVMQLLRRANSAHITLEILPLSQLNCGWRLSESSVRSRGGLRDPLKYR